MFKVILLVVLVSVVWTRTDATYTLDTYDEPVFQSDIHDDFDDDHHDLNLHHISSHPVSYSNHPLNSFHEIGESTRFHRPDTSDNYPSQHHFDENAHNNHAHENHNIHQQQIDIRSSDHGFTESHRHQPSYQSSHTDKKDSPSYTFNQNEYFDGIGQTHNDKSSYQSSKSVPSDHTNSQHTSQQKVIDVDFKHSSAPKSEGKTSVKGHDTHVQNSHTSSQNHHQEQNYNHSPNTNNHKGNNIFNSPKYEFPGIQKIPVFPVIYSRFPVIPTPLIRLHDQNAKRYSSNHNSFGTSGTVLRALEGIPLHPGIHSNGAYRLDHSIPVLIDSSFPYNVNTHGNLLLGIGHQNFRGSFPHAFQIGNVSHTHASPNHLEQQTYENDDKIEQKSVIEQSSIHSFDDSTPEYKGISNIDLTDYKDNTKSGISHKVEQKPLNDGLKGKHSEQKHSYESGVDESKYKNNESPSLLNYAESNARSSEYNLEQKSVEVGIKSDNTGITSKYPAQKSLKTGTQQKSIDVEIKQSQENDDYKPLSGFGSEYSGIGSIGAPKYPESSVKHTEQKTEQKSVETETYREVKATFKSSKDLSGSIGSSYKSNADHISSAINNIKKDVDSKLEHHIPVFSEKKLSDSKSQRHLGTGGRASHTNFFNTRHPSAGYNSRTYNDRPKTTGSSYSGIGGSSPRHSDGNYFGRGHSSSYGRPHRPSPVSNIHPYSAHRDSSRINHQKTNSFNRPLVTNTNRYPDHHSTFNNRGRPAFHLGIQENFPASAIKNYHERGSGGISSSRYPKVPNSHYNDKPLQAKYEYPKHPLSKKDQSYVSPIKPSYDNKKSIPVATHRPFGHQYSSLGHSSSRPYPPSPKHSSQAHGEPNYLNKDSSGSSDSLLSYLKSDVTSSGIEYSDGIGAVDYSGIDKSSRVSDNNPKHYNSHITKPQVTEQKPYNEHKIEQKQYDSHKTEQMPYEEHKIEQKQYDSHKTEQKPYEEQKNQQKPYDSHKTEQKPYESHKIEQKPYAGHKIEQKPYENRKIEQSSYKSPEIQQKTYEEPKVEQKPYESLKTEQKAYEDRKPEQKPYSSIASQFKPYEPEDSLPTYHDEKMEANQPHSDEYKGIGELGSEPIHKSEIVGGRYPVKRPIKSSHESTKSSRSGVKGKTGVKTEQKYLPITASLSDSKGGPTYPKSSSIKTKTPEKVEQEDLAYEALLAGAGPGSTAGALSGYGFNKPDASSGGSSPYGSADDEHSAPMPYEFEFDIKDDEHGSEQFRKEKMDDSGHLTGSYGYKDGEGIYREVEYEATKEGGFKVHKIKTNEPGTDNEDPADVHFEVQKSSPY